MPTAELSGIVDALREIRDMSSRVGPAADQYIDLLSDPGNRVAVNVEGFYYTYNSSFVYVFGTVNTCSCSECNPSTNPLKGLSGFGGLLMTAMQSADSIEKFSPCTKDDKVSSSYKVVVLKGGHGYSRAAGSKPGGFYSVDDGGFPNVSFDPLDKSDRPEEDMAPLDPILLGVAGMSLKKSVEVSIQ